MKTVRVALTGRTNEEPIETDFIYNGNSVNIVALNITDNREGIMRKITNAYLLGDLEHHLLLHRRPEVLIFISNISVDFQALFKAEFRSVFKTRFAIPRER